jgi:hypothetical protein
MNTILIEHQMYKLHNKSVGVINDEASSSTLVDGFSLL